MRKGNCTDFLFKTGEFLRFEPCCSSAQRSLDGSESLCFSEMLAASSGCGTARSGVTPSHMVKCKRLRAVWSTSVFTVGDTVSTGSSGRHWEVMRWEKDSCKAVGQLDCSCVRRHSGESSESAVWSVWVKTLLCPRSDRSAGESDTSCSGKWKVKEGSVVSLWVTSAGSGWNVSGPGNS